MTDFYKINYLCGDYSDITASLGLIENPSSGSITLPLVDSFLFDDEGSDNFMYFWSTDTVSPKTHHFMTVQEFYDLFDTTTKTPYEYW